MKKYALINFMFLQLFAVQTTDMNSKGNDLSPGMRTFYDDTLIDIVGPKLVHDQDAVKKPIPANNGNKIQFRCARFVIVAQGNVGLVHQFAKRRQIAFFKRGGCLQRALVFIHGVFGAALFHFARN